MVLPKTPTKIRVPLGHSTKENEGIPVRRVLQLSQPNKTYPTKLTYTRKMKHSIEHRPSHLSSKPRIHHGQLQPTSRKAKFHIPTLTYRRIPELAKNYTNPEQSHDQGYSMPTSYLPEEFIPPRHKFVSRRHPVKSPAVNDCKTVSSSLAEYVWKLQPNDIVCGRGAPTNFHPGNQAFRDLVKEYQTVYLCAKRSDKPRLALEVLEKIRSRGGRFFRRVKTTAGRGAGFAWEEIGEKRAYEKVCQALREGAPELRRQMLISSQLRQPLMNNDKENKDHIQCF